LTRLIMEVPKRLSASSFSGDNELFFDPVFTVYKKGRHFSAGGTSLGDAVRMESTCFL